MKSSGSFARKLIACAWGWNRGFVFTTTRLHFSPATTVCQCGADTCVLKTQKKTLATLAIGQFEVLETQRRCHRCGDIYRSEELRSLTPHRGQFGFDVIETIGRALFVQCRNALAVQADLAARNMPSRPVRLGFWANGLSSIWPWRTGNATQSSSSTWPQRGVTFAHGRYL